MHLFFQRMDRHKRGAYAISLMCFHNKKLRIIYSANMPLSPKVVSRPLRQELIPIQGLLLRQGTNPSTWPLRQETNSSKLNLLCADIDNYFSLAWYLTNLNTQSHNHVCIENNILLPKRLSHPNFWIITDVLANCWYRRRDCLSNYCTCKVYLYVLQLEIVGILGTL